MEKEQSFILERAGGGRSLDWAGFEHSKDGFGTNDAIFLAVCYFH